MTRPTHIVAERSLDWKDESHGSRYGWRRKQLSTAAGGQKIGCSLYELPPGRRSFPYHHHCANEEAIFVLEGAGTLKHPQGETPIVAGDYVALPASERGAHQVINSSDAPLRYLCVSTMIEPDVSIYPESGKIGVFVGSAPGGSEEKRTLKAFLRLTGRVGYWDGEE